MRRRVLRFVTEANLRSVGLKPKVIGSEKLRPAMRLGISAPAGLLSFAQLCVPRRRASRPFVWRGKPGREAGPEAEREMKI